MLGAMRPTMGSEVPRPAAAQPPVGAAEHNAVATLVTLYGELLARANVELAQARAQAEEWRQRYEQLKAATPQAPAQAAAEGSGGRGSHP
jgi:hypothetical protein